MRVSLPAPLLLSLAPRSGERVTRGESRAAGEGQLGSVFWPCVLLFRCGLARGPIPNPVLPEEKNEGTEHREAHHSTLVRRGPPGEGARLAALRLRHFSAAVCAS